MRLGSVERSYWILLYSISIVSVLSRKIMTLPCNVVNGMFMFNAFFTLQTDNPSNVGVIRRRLKADRHRRQLSVSDV